MGKKLQLTEGIQESISSLFQIGMTLESVSINLAISRHTIEKWLSAGKSGYFPGGQQEKLYKSFDAYRRTKKAKVMAARKTVADEKKKVIDQELFPESRP